MDVEQAREAEERRAALAANGLPGDTAYGRVVMTGTDAGTVHYDLADVLPDGRVRRFGVGPGRAEVEWRRPYVVTIYGVFGNSPLPVAPLPPLSQVTQRQWHFGTAEDAAAGRGELSVVMLRATVRHGTAGVYAELRWHPDGGESLSVRGLEHRRTDEDWLLAWRGVSQLREVVAGGRDALDPLQVRDEMYANYYAILARGERPTEPRLAEAMALHVSSIQARKRILKAAHIPYPPPPRPRAGG